MLGKMHLQGVHAGLELRLKDFETAFMLTVGLCRGCEDNRVFFKASLALHRADLFPICTRGPFPWFFFSF